MCPGHEAEAQGCRGSQRVTRGGNTIGKLNRWVVLKSNKIKELWRARSLLYRRGFLRPNTHFSAFFEIYKIQKPLHLWNPRVGKAWKNPLRKPQTKTSENEQSYKTEKGEKRHLTHSPAFHTNAASKRDETTAL